MKINPFKPNYPIGYTMFAGRAKECREVLNGLFQTAKGHPYHFLITGERGAGKTSFGKFIRITAEKQDDHTFHIPRFLCVSIVLSKDDSIISIIRATQDELESKLLIVEPIRGYWKKIVEFVSRVKVNGSGIEKKSDESEIMILVKEFAKELCDVSQRVAGFRKNARAGMLLIFDEASEVSKETGLGIFFKNFMQYVDQNNCNTISCMLIGLPDLKDKINNVNSSGRMFNEINLGRMSINESKDVIIRGMALANIENHGSDKLIIMHDDVLNKICEIADGAPYLIQKIASSAFDFDTDWVITMDDLLGCSAYKSICRQ